jgi:hypothetical protein
VEGWFALVLCTFKCFRHDNQTLDYIHLFTRLYNCYCDLASRSKFQLSLTNHVRQYSLQKTKFCDSCLEDFQLLEVTIAALRAKLQRE